MQVAVSEPGNRSDIRRTIAKVLLLTAIIVASYLPGLSGPFLFDDLQNIVQNSALAINSLNWSSLSAAAMSGGAGPSGRPISMVSFALNHWLAGEMNPVGFKAVNIFIHCINALLLLALLRTYASHAGIRCSSNLALLITACWALHPINLTSVLYVVQRMNSLSALFTLVGLLGYFWALRDKGGRPALQSLVALSALAGATVLASLSKENGALTVGFALMLDYFAVRNRQQAEQTSAVPSSTAWKFRLASLSAVTIAVIGACIYFGLTSTYYDNRQFSLGQRLLTQPMVLWSYLSDILLPTLSSPSFYQDNTAISAGLMAPPTTVFAIVGWIVVVAAAVIAYRRRAWLVPILGICWYLFGHFMESSFLPLELAFDHRNYLPSVGVFVLAVVFARWILTETHTSDSIRLATAVATICALFMLNTHRAWVWGDELRFIAHQVKVNPNSARVQHLAGKTLEVIATSSRENRSKFVEEAAAAYRQAAELDPDNAGSLLRLLMLQRANGNNDQLASVETEFLSRMQFARALPMNGNTLSVALQEAEDTSLLEPNLAFRAVDAFEQNQRASTQQILQAKIALAQYTYNVLSAPQIAHDILDSAVALAPENPQPYLTKALLAAESRHGDPDFWLTEAKRRDPDVRFYKEYIEIEQQISGRQER